MSAAWVYICRDADERVIYVGATKSVFTRLAQHAAASFWAPAVARVTAKVYPSMELALAAERDAIRQHDPRWNVRGRWQNRLRWTAADYADYVTAISLGASPRTSQNRLRMQRAAAESAHRFPAREGAVA